MGGFELQRCLLSFVHCSVGGGGKVPLLFSASHYGISFVPFSLGCPGVDNMLLLGTKVGITRGYYKRFIENHHPDLSLNGTMQMCHLD